DASSTSPATRRSSSRRRDPGAVADHVLRTVLPDGPDAAAAPGGAGDGGEEDVVLLAARFD
ncbi:hypothetical protein ACWDZX_01015, partial [Streptomyces collinus]